MYFAVVFVHKLSGSRADFVLLDQRTFAIFTWKYYALFKRIFECKKGKKKKKKYLAQLITNIEFWPLCGKVWHFIMRQRFIYLF